MQVKQLSALIERYGVALTSAAATEAGAWTKAVADALAVGGTRATDKFLSAVEKSFFRPAAEATSFQEEARDFLSAPALGNVVPVLENLILVLKAAGAKKGAVTDLVLLLDLARRQGQILLTELESSARGVVASASSGKTKPGAAAMDTKKLIETYLQRLEAALGNDALFRAIYRELSADEKVTRVEAAELASRFFEPTAPSTTRPKALQKILRRHEKLMESRAASSSIGGRAA